MGPRIREDNEGKGNKIPRLRCARNDMWAGEKAGFPPPSAGTTEGGMGPRIREDNEGKGNKIPRLRCARNDMWSGENE